MTPVDLHVKESMLEYASIYPTRLKVLEHDFFVLGNGKDWQEDGTIGENYVKPKKELPEGIYVEDLNKFIAETAADFEKFGEDIDRDRLIEYEAEKSKRMERLKLIDVIASTVDPKGEIKGGYYGQLANILLDLENPNYTGRPYLNIWNVPANVEASWWAAACEAMEAAIRGSTNPEDRHYARLCWDAMTDFVEGRAESFVVPAKPETHAERMGRHDAEHQLRVAAYEETKRIERILNRAGYVLNMKDKSRCETHMSNGTFSMKVYKATVLTEETIAKIDRSMTKAGYVRTENHLPTWENGKEHRVALRLFPFKDREFKARILYISHPEDENSSDTKKRAWFAAAQRRFDIADDGSEYVPPAPPVVKAAPVASQAVYQVVPGSLELKGGMVTAGVHTGSHEWDVKNLRYVRADMTKVTDKNRTLISILSEVYDNSTGCLMKKTFKMNA